jgi:hypothetical protein
MKSMPESVDNTSEKLSKAGTEAYLSALHIFATGCAASLALTIFAVLTLFMEDGDSAGPGFFVLGFLAITVFLASSIVSLVKSIVGIINYVEAMLKSDNPKELKDNIFKNLALILGIVFAGLIVYKLIF